MKEPLVSIIVPTYNVERYIDECLESIQAQTYPNVETIVIDDGSSDATPYLLKPYTENFSIQFNEKNQGQGAVRNQAMQQAKGKYVLFVDSDDWIEPETVEMLVQKAEETKADLVRFNGIPFFEGAGEDSLKKQYDFSSILEERVYIDEEMLIANRKSFSASPCLYMVRREVIEKDGIRFLEGVLHEDEYFTTKLFVHCKRMAYINKSFYHRRYRLASTMTERTPHHRRKSFDSYMEVFRQLEKEYRNENYTSKQQAFIKRQLLSIYNGMKKSDVAPILKKDLKKLESITWIDRLRVGVSSFRNRV